MRNGLTTSSLILASVLAAIGLVLFVANSTVSNITSSLDGLEQRVAAYSSGGGGKELLVRQTPITDLIFRSGVYLDSLQEAQDKFTVGTPKVRQAGHNNHVPLAIKLETGELGGCSAAVWELLEQVFVLSAGHCNHPFTDTIIAVLKYSDGNEGIPQHYAELELIKDFRDQGQDAGIWFAADNTSEQFLARIAEPFPVEQPDYDGYMTCFGFRFGQAHPAGTRAMLVPRQGIAVDQHDFRPNNPDLADVMIYSEQMWPGYSGSNCLNNFGEPVGIAVAIWNDFAGAMSSNALIGISTPAPPSFVEGLEVIELVRGVVRAKALTFNAPTDIAVPGNWGELSPEEQALWGEAYRADEFFVYDSVDLDPVTDRFTTDSIEILVRDRGQFEIDSRERRFKVFGDLQDLAELIPGWEFESITPIKAE